MKSAVFYAICLVPSAIAAAVAKPGTSLPRNELSAQEATKICQKKAANFKDVTDVESYSAEEAQDIDFVRSGYPGVRTIRFFFFLLDFPGLKNNLFEVFTKRLRN